MNMGCREHDGIRQLELLRLAQDRRVFGDLRIEMDTFESPEKSSDDVGVSGALSGRHYFYPCHYAYQALRMSIQFSGCFDYSVQ